MSKQAYNDFRENWLKIYIRQYKTGTKKERTAIKRNLYSNVNLTENEKDKLWGIIIRKCFLSNE